MSDTFELRPYQQECIDTINSQGPGSYLIVMSTGLGKTVVFSHISRPGRTLILSHREELVHQPEKYYDCSFGVERAEEVSNGEDVISASVQTLIHRLDKFAPDEFDTIITDEAHHSVAPSYRKIYDYFQPRLHLGFTATPNRADKLHLGDIYSQIIFDRDIRWGIENNYLCDIECHRINVGYDLSKVHTRLGDFALNELSDAVDQGKCNEAVAAVYEQYAHGPTLIFAASVSHAENIASLIPDAQVITATTPNRSEILNGYMAGEIPCIVNCMVLTEGTDLPCTETIMMCRPTKNISLYTQAVGRGTRLYPGKEKLNLIDCVGVSSLDICTAPQLFGIDPSVAEKTGVTEGLLSEMEGQIEDIQQKWMFDKNFWKLNDELVDLFTDGGAKYDIHDMNLTVLGNKDMICSIGKKQTIRLTAEDMLGNTDIIMFEGRKILHRMDGIKMQDALDKVSKFLTDKYWDQRFLWNSQFSSKWSQDKASFKQIDLIKNIYTRQELNDLGVIAGNLNKYQASVLIARKFASR